MLRASAERVRSCLRSSDTAARIGGDEFGVLIEDMVHLGGSIVLAEQLLAACREPIQVGPNLLWTTLSIGITFDTPGATVEQLLQYADRAMYTAKKNGKDRYEIIDGRDLLDEDVACPRQPVDHAGRPLRSGRARGLGGRRADCVGTGSGPKHELSQVRPAGSLDHRPGGRPGQSAPRNIVRPQRLEKP